MITNCGVTGCYNSKVLSAEVEVAVTRVLVVRLVAVVVVLK